MLVHIRPNPYPDAMTVWRPAPSIRLKALGLHWRRGRLLAAEIPDDAGRVKGVRPLGGTVEFGETAEVAVRREFHEELGVTAIPLGPPAFIENIYTHEGAIGHEILAIFDLVFEPDPFKGIERIAFREDSGMTCFAEWFDPEALDCPGGLPLFPTGLKTHLTRDRQPG